MKRVAIIPGDGIGVDVTAEAVQVLKAAAARFGLEVSFREWDLGAERYLREGVTIRDEEFRELAETSDGILLGALGDPRVPSNVHARDILLGLRFKLDLYVNFRPSLLLHPSLTPLKGFEERAIRLEIFRENTEDLYVDLGGRFRADTPNEVAIQESIHTRYGVERIVRAAFEHARARGRGRVTLVDKANAMPSAGALWRRVFREVGEGFTGIDRDMMYVDAVAMDLVRRPDRYEVIVTSNLFGDILSDLAAELTGGLGLAPSANIHPGRIGLFEPVHGSAPDIAGKGIANPLGAIRSAALLAEHLGSLEMADAIEAAARASILEGIRTPDLGGTASTEEVGGWITERVQRA
ncbi:MAG: isocitrate/isopropylmalate dehydrogenase family protein [Gemmatimonadota bacterium]